MNDQEALSKLDKRGVFINTEVVRGREMVLDSTLDSAINTKVFLEAVVDGLVIEVERRVAATQPEHIYFHRKVPRTWWDHFKRDVLLPLTENPSTRLGERILGWVFSTISFEEIEVDRTVYRKVCPHLDLGDRYRHVEWLANIGGVGH